MNKISKTIVACVLCFFTLFMTAFAVQDDNMKLSSQIKVAVNDQDVDTVPIIYQGSAYLNIREIAPWVDLKVDYDKNTQTIDLSGMDYASTLNDTTIMTIDQSKVTLGHFNALAKWNRFYAGLKTISSDQNSAFKEFVREQVVEEEAVKLLAKDNNIEMTADDYNAVNKQIEEVASKFNKRDDFITYLYNDIGISYINYACIQEYLHLREKVRNQLVGDISENEMKSYYNTHQSAFLTDNATVEHILFQTTDENGNILPYDEKKKVEQEALIVLNKINNHSISFEEAMQTHSDDQSYLKYPDGFVVQESGVQPEFWRAVNQMKTGEISTLVETKYGYHIIKVMSKSAVLPFDEVKEQVLEIMKNSAFNDVLKTVTDKFSITYNKDIYDSYAVY